MAKATHLECSLCKQTHAADQVQHLCACGGPLLVRYDLEAIRKSWSPAQVREGPNTMWRYAPVLPPAKESIVTLGEGMTVSYTHLDVYKRQAHHRRLRERFGDLR